MSRKSPQSERSWRGSSRSKSPERASRSDAKWTLLIFTVLMIAGLIYFMWPRPRMVTHFVTIQTGANDRLAVPFIPSLSLTEYLTRHATYQGANRYFVESDFTSLWERRSDSTGNGAASIAERISSLPVEEKDVLVLRITAHGACDLASEGSAELLCRDFEIPDSDESPVASLPVDTIFQSMSKSPAHKKLLILDMGNLACDPRLGSLINQFPQRVAEAVGRHDDPDLWVLLSNAVAQTNALGSPQEQTIFADSVFEGLLGRADTGPFSEAADGFVTLKELYGFVAGSCTAATSGTQTPLLLNGSTQYQYSDIPPSITLARLSKKIASDAEAAVAMDEVEGSTDEPKEELATDQSSATEEPAGEESIEAPKVVDDNPPPGRSNRDNSNTNKMLNSAWKIRDELQSAEALGPAWRPIDFSPHRWRAVNESLLSLERRYRCGGEQLQESIEPALARDLRVLEALRDFLRGEPVRENGGTDSYPRSVLLDAERLNEQDATSAKRIKRPLQIYNHALFEIPSFIRWHANSTYGQSVNPSTSDVILALIDATDTQRKLLERANNREFKKQDEQRIVEQSRRVGDALTDAREMLNAQIELALSDPTSPRSVSQIEAFLQSSLPNAEQRTRLLNAREIVPEFELPETLPDADNVLGAQEWAWANSQLELESRLLELVTDDPVEQKIANSWQHLQSASRSLRIAYQALPSNTHEAPIGHRLFFVDARDSARVASTMASLGYWNLPTHEIGVSVDVADISTSVDTTSPASVVVQLSNPEQKTVTVRVGRFDKISVAYSESPAGPFRSIPPRGEIRTTTNANGTATLYFQIQANAEQKAESVNPVEELQFQISADEPYYTKPVATIACYLPKENRIDLVARLVDATGVPFAGLMRREATWAGRPLQSIELFPNTETGYKLYLSNRSGKPKLVDVQLLKVPTAPGQLGLHRFDTQALRRMKSRIIDPDTSKPWPRIKVLAKTSQPIDLPLDGKQTFLQLSPPSPPGESTSAPPETPEGADAPNRGTDVTSGLVCLISNADGSGESWLKWIGLLPRHPSTYVDTVAKVTENNNLFVTVKARADAPLPIPVEFELPNRTNQLDVIENANVPIEFSVDGSTLDGPSFDVVLHVQGYPRAIVMRTELGAGDFETREADRNRRTIRIQGIRVDKQAVDLSNSLTRSTAFQMAKPSLVHVQLAVDAPVDEFGRGADDRVRITLGQGAAQKREVFDFDRKMMARFQPLGKQGQLIFETTVGDISTALRSNATNVTATLQAELTAGGQTIDDHHTLILDGSPPRGEVNVAVRKLKMGTDARFRWLAKDRSGISKAEFALVDDQTKPFPDEAKTYPQKVTSDRMQTFQLPTAELKIETGGSATFWVKGRFTDGVGFSSVVRSNPIVVSNIPTQQAGGDGDEGPVTGTLVVVVQVASGITPQKPTATIKDHDELTGVEVSNGRFEFADVPADKYDIVVTGITGGRPKEGTRTVILKAPSDYAKTYPVDVK